MGLYLPVRARGSVAIAICDRCKMKMHYEDLSPDVNYPGLKVCKDCSDLYDPYRLPARKADDITLHHPRPDEDLV